MKVESRALVFECEHNELVGILDVPESINKRGIVIITGGPQYRVGSHRQFVLLARTLADSGYPVLRFDYRGMGDSDGPFSGFQGCRADICAAIKTIQREACVTEVVLWGLCDAAAASLMYVADEPPVAGLILINPWVRSDYGLARAYLRHYYVRRLFSTEFLKRVLTGRLQFRKAWSDFLETVDNTLNPNSRRVDTPVSESTEIGGPDFRELMRKGLSNFDGPVLIILSGDDLTASEFIDYTKRDRRWRKMLRHRLVTQQRLEGGDHTFSRQAWRNTVADWTLEWLKAW